MLNAIAQATPYVGLGLVIADKNFTPFGNGPALSDSPATNFDKGAGVAGTLASEVAGPMGQRVANDVISSRFYDHSRGNRAERQFQRNVDTHVTWGTARQVAKYTGRALGVLGALSAGAQGSGRLASLRVQRKMNYRPLVVSVLWLIATFVYAASLANYYLPNGVRAEGLIAVALLAIAASITRSRIYLNLYDSQPFCVTSSTVSFLKALSWILVLFTCVILILHFSMPENSPAKSNNALLSIFAYMVFFSGRSLLLRPFQKTRR